MNSKVWSVSSVAAAPLALCAWFALSTAGVAEPVPDPVAPAAATDEHALTGPAVGMPAPDFTLVGLDGKRVSLADYRGKTLVLNVWATWCPPCRDELPDLVASSAALAKRSDVAFLGVDSTELAPIVRAYTVAKQVPYAQAIDVDQAFSTSYDVVGFPTTFVIGPDGVLRARYVDVVSRAQVLAFVTAAQAGRDGSIVSPLQTKIDTALNDPAIVFEGDAASLIAAANAADKAIAHAEDLLAESDASTGNATDFLRTRLEQATLRDRAVAALAPVASTGGDRALLAKLRGDAARDREQWSDALADYRELIALEPNDAGAWTRLQAAADYAKAYDVAADAARHVVALEPDVPDDYVDLGVLLARAGKQSDADAAFTQAVAVAERKLAADPHKPSALRKLAFVHLYFGRNYAEAHDAVRASEEFRTTLALAARLPAKDARHDMYIEEAQEAIVALGLTSPEATTVSLAPWTGAELPGSVPNTLKYRLVVAGAGGKSVALRAEDVPKGWVASFCTDRLCSPFRVSVDLPSSGVKVIEFQLVPPNAGAKASGVRVIESDGAHSASATIT